MKHGVQFGPVVGDRGSRRYNADLSDRFIKTFSPLGRPHTASNCLDRTGSKFSDHGERERQRVSVDESRELCPSRLAAPPGQEREDVSVDEQWSLRDVPGPHISARIDMKASISESFTLSS